MKLKLKRIGLGAGRPVAFLNNSSARKIDVDIGERVRISYKEKEIIAIVDVVKKFLKPNEISVSEEIIEALNLKEKATIEVNPALEPISTTYIAKKLDGKELTEKEIFSIVEDIVKNALTEAEIAYFVSGVYEKGMTSKEIIHLTRAMYETGEKIVWKNKKIIDKHSIGGIPGNRTTPIVVSICAAAGLIIPKTSSRAITSAAGTADVIETTAKVDLDLKQLKDVVKKTNGCLVWGGSLNMAPADDKLIRVERLLGLDPESQLIASIMSKKLAVGSKYVLIDIPYGKYAKVSRKKALKLKRDFITVAKSFGIKIDVVLTDGNQPIGNGIGPSLELKDVLRVLERNNPPKDLEKKSIFLSGKLLELSKITKKGNGIEIAKKILNSGKALKKFNQILNAQGIINHQAKVAKYTYNLKSKKTGKLKEINNKSIAYLARILGCPFDKTAGIYLNKHTSETIKKGETILVLHSESKRKLNQAKKILKELKLLVFA